MTATAVVTGAGRASAARSPGASRDVGTIALTPRFGLRQTKMMHRIGERKRDKEKTHRG